LNFTIKTYINFLEKSSFDISITKKRLEFVFLSAMRVKPFGKTTGEIL